MARISIDETDIKALVVIVRENGVVRLFVNAESYDAEGKQVRIVRHDDITDKVAAATRNGAAGLLAQVETRLRNLWEIPAPIATPSTVSKEKVSG